MRTGEAVTLRQLAHLLRGEIAWMRLYLSADGRDEENCMSREEMNQAVLAYGDRTVRRLFPGYRFVIVWLDSEY